MKKSNKNLENCPKKCENGVFDIIEKAKYLCKEADELADNMMKCLMDSSWISKYMGDGIVIVAHSSMIRSIRKAIKELKDSCQYLENQIVLSKTTKYYDNVVLEKLERLNIIVDSVSEKE